MDPKFDKMGILLFYNDIIYRSNHLFCIVLELDTGKPPLSSERNGKFINFLSIIQPFQFETINPQELASGSQGVSVLFGYLLYCQL